VSETPDETIRRLTTERNEAIAELVPLRSRYMAAVNQQQETQGRCNVAENVNRELREKLAEAMARVTEAVADEKRDAERFEKLEAELAEARDWLARYHAIERSEVMPVLPALDESKRKLAAWEPIVKAAVSLAGDDPKGNMLGTAFVAMIDALKETEKP